jgi:two-component system KDP operon response regulator KdpE
MIKRSLVLVVEDDAVMRHVLSVALVSQGYEVRAAKSGVDALLEVERQVPDVMLLDMGLPDMDGVEVTTRVRQQHELPIIVVSARGEEEQQIRALDCGAHDYVTKPFRQGELMARVRAALRRPVLSANPPEIVVGDLHLDTVQRRTSIAGQPIALTPNEWKLLLILARHPDQVVTHQHLLREVWGGSRVDETQYLRVYMRQLRVKLGKTRAGTERIVTALGVGYRLAVPES